MNHVAKKQQGFTIIELLLAMSFVAALLIGIALTIVQIGATYNRGLTLKEVNQTGRSISDDIRRNLAGSNSFNATTNFVTPPDGSGGRLCTGQFSYIWNYAQALDESRSGVVEYVGTETPVRLVKLRDASSAYCARNGAAFTYQDIRTVDQDTAIELLTEGDRALSIHDFQLTTPANGADGLTGQQLYTASFVIGTGDTAALTDDKRSCKAPGLPGADFTYCAVQEFSLVIRVGNRVN